MSDHYHPLQQDPSDERPSVHMPKSPSGILVSPPDPLSKHKKPRIKKRVSIDVHVPLDRAYSFDKQHPLLPEDVIRIHAPHTKDIHGRFKNRRPLSHPLDSYGSEDEVDGDIREEQEEDNLKEVSHHYKSENYTETVRRMSKVIIPNRRPSSIHLGFLSKDKIKLKKKKKNRTRSSSSSIHSGYSLLEGQSSKTYLIESPDDKESIEICSFSSPDGKSSKSESFYIDTENAWAKKNFPEDLIEQKKKQESNNLILPPFCLIFLGMGVLLVAFATTGATSKKMAIVGCGILSSGGILMILSLCYYYVKSECMPTEAELDKIRKLSESVLPMKSMISFTGSK